MELDGFRTFLQDRKQEEKDIDAAISIIGEFNRFLSNQKKPIEKASYEDLYNFSEYLMEKGKNTFENFIALFRFGQFQKNKEVEIGSLEVLDGLEMIPNFSKRLIEEFGEPLRNEIFEEIEMPPLGIRPQQKVEVTKKLVERFLAKVDYERCRMFFEVGLRDKYTKSYEKPIELFEEVKDIDEFLRIRHQTLVKNLEEHRKEGTLFFTQEVDDEVISYVQHNKSIESGTRKGDRVIITKIPYLTKQFLHETNPRKKRYNFCHNPWIRHALLEEDQPIDPVFCGCSAGYFKNFWEAVLKQPVRVEVLKSVIRGDSICEFALHLPRNYC
ncbi:MAG: hypothetical protein ACFE89_12275 [Candidatus Hodarchaeota archaeon]